MAQDLEIFLVLLSFAALAVALCFSCRPLRTLAKQAGVGPVLLPLTTAS